MATQYAFQVASPENGMVTGSVTVTKDCTPVTETVFGDVNGGEWWEGGWVCVWGGGGAGREGGHTHIFIPFEDGHEPKGVKVILLLVSFFIVFNHV